MLGLLSSKLVVDREVEVGIGCVYLALLLRNWEITISQFVN